jgi:hypothetical protein
MFDDEFIQCVWSILKGGTAGTEERDWRINMLSNYDLMHSKRLISYICRQRQTRDAIRSALNKSSTWQHALHSAVK